jgi:lipase chaperone LimK
MKIEKLKIESDSGLVKENKKKCVAIDTLYIAFHPNKLSNSYS